MSVFSESVSVTQAIAYLSTFVGGGLGGTVLNHFLEKGKYRDEKLFERRCEVYKALLDRLRHAPREDAAFESATIVYITEALLLVTFPEAKDILRKTAAELRARRYWNSSSRIKPRDIRRLEELMQQEMGIRVPFWRRLSFHLSGARYKNVRGNDSCPCGGGKKYKKCHGA
ncbi:MAG: SEC-C metal-binding domain-containing protein [Patescibacteria group bacterium]